MKFLHRPEACSVILTRLEARFPESDGQHILFHPMRPRCVGRIKSTESGVDVELWRFDPGMLGSAMPHFYGRLRKEQAGSVIEGRFALAPHVRVLLVMAAFPLAGMGLAFGNQRAWGSIGSLGFALCAIALLGGVFLLLKRQAERVTWRDITRAASGEDI